MLRAGRNQGGTRLTEYGQLELAGGRATSLLRYPAARRATAVYVMAHGAGADQQSAFMTGMAGALAARGVEVVTFNFPFTAQVRRLPDPQPILESCFRSVLAHVARDPDLAALPLLIGGKSLGGRMATHVAAAPDADASDARGWAGRLRGLVLLGYPLHPPGRVQAVRVTHLPRITTPMLFVQGSKDAFGTPAELRVFLDVLPSSCTLHIVEGGDHSFARPKRSGITPDQTLTEVADVVEAWLRTVVSARPRRAGP
jgi:predicted alpha/beta-hydrolase family hydrolase